MEPDIVLFTSMVDAAFRSGVVRAAEYWQSRSSNAGCVANKVMLSTLVKGCAQAGYKEKALRWATQALESLEAGDDLVILNCIIDIHAKNADPSSLKEATLALEKIRTPDERSFGPIINAYAERGKLWRSIEIFQAPEGGPWVPKEGDAVDACPLDSAVFLLILLMDLFQSPSKKMIRP